MIEERIVAWSADTVRNAPPVVAEQHVSRQHISGIRRKLTLLWYGTKGIASR